MHYSLIGVGILAMGMMASCFPAPRADTRPVNARIRHACTSRSSAILVTHQANWNPTLKFEEDGLRSVPDDADGGSAAPIAGDGYFLTAAHVVDQSKGDHVYVCYGYGGDWHRARVVWRSPMADLALVHVPIQTPRYYRWTSGHRWLPVGTYVFHVGIATGADARGGQMMTPLRPESFWTGSRFFKIDMPLLPGDSGGAVLDANGHLVGINSAVEYLVPVETAFFVASEACRPDVKRLNRIIENDRRRRVGW